MKARDSSARETFRFTGFPSPILKIILTLFLGWPLQSKAQLPFTDSNPVAINTPFSENQASELLKEASNDTDDGKLDQALQKVDAALEFDTRNSSAYELRGSIYIQKELWDRAEADYSKALEIDPTTIAFKYKLAEIKFLQKAFDAARPRYMAIENDPNLGDLALYKVLLCDLLSGNESVAATDLDRIDRAGKNPSYYFGHAMWNVYHKKLSEANAFFGLADSLYSAHINSLYLSDLRELNALSAPIVTFVTRDGNSYNQVKVFVEDTGLRVSTATGWTTIPFQQLPDDLSAFPLDLRTQIIAKCSNAPDPSARKELLSFSTKSGQHYDQVKWSIDDTGLRVLTLDGWKIIPLNQLPADLSTFPDELRERITAIRSSASDTVTGRQEITFTTKAGKFYDAVDWSIDDAGLNVLTSDGWQIIALDQLPSDLSVFPQELRGQIVETLAGYPPAEKPVAEAKRNMTPSGEVGKIDPEQFNLFPTTATDTHFGSCIAAEGTTWIIGSNQAIYIYKDSKLSARLCPESTSAQSPNEISAVCFSNGTIAASMTAGVDIWTGTPQGWQLQATLDIKHADTLALDRDNLVVGISNGGETVNTLFFFRRKADHWFSVPTTFNRDQDSALINPLDLAVALKGSVAAIGVPNGSKLADDSRGLEYSGRVFLERYDGQQWTEHAQLTANEEEGGANRFGESVALCEDQLAVSSSNRDLLDYAPHHGVVYLFNRTDKGWKKSARISSPSPGDDAEFGDSPMALSRHTLAIGDSGVTAIVPNIVLDNGQSSGKPGEIRKAGAVYVFENDILQETLRAPDPEDALNGEGSRDQFGASLALSGETILIGAKDKDGGTGAVYVWTRNHNQWSLFSELRGFHRQVDFDY